MSTKFLYWRGYGEGFPAMLNPEILETLSNTSYVDGYAIISIDNSNIDTRSRGFLDIFPSFPNRFSLVIHEHDHSDVIRFLNEDNRDLFSNDVLWQAIASLNRFLFDEKDFLKEMKNDSLGKEFQNIDNEEAEFIKMLECYDARYINPASENIGYDLDEICFKFSDKDKSFKFKNRFFQEIIISILKENFVGGYKSFSFQELFTRRKWKLSSKLVNYLLHTIYGTENVSKSKIFSIVGRLFSLAGEDANQGTINTWYQRFNKLEQGNANI